MSYETILLGIADGVATITLNRPEVMNGLNAQMRLEITHALRHAPERARAVVLTGTGGAFCAGQDLGDARGVPGSEIATLVATISMHGCGPTILAISSGEAPPSSAKWRATSSDSSVRASLPTIVTL